MDVDLSVKMTYLLTFPTVHAILSLNQRRKYCFALTPGTLLNVIREL